MVMTPRPFEILRDEHRVLIRLFALHQESLLSQDWEGARRMLERYCGLMQRHIEIEERFLVAPRETGRVGMRWPAEVYRSEHQRIMQRLERIAERVARGGLRRVRPSGLIALLDQERALKHLIEQHHHREEVALFNEMRRALPADTRAALGRALDTYQGVAGAVPATL